MEILSANCGPILVHDIYKAEKAIRVIPLQPHPFYQQFISLYPPKIFSQIPSGMHLLTNCFCARGSGRPRCEITVRPNIRGLLVILKYELLLHKQEHALYKDVCYLHLQCNCDPAGNSKITVFQVITRYGKLRGVTTNLSKSSC